MRDDFCGALPWDRRKGTRQPGSLKAGFRVEGVQKKAGETETIIGTGRLKLARERVWFSRGA